MNAKLLLLVPGVLLAQSSNPKVIAAKDAVLVAEPPPLVRTVSAGPHDVIRVRAKVRHSTLIVLPKSEKILDFLCGDAGYWKIEGAENLAYVKPAKTGSQTNLNLVTASGNIYSFLLNEVSDDRTSGPVPDIKVFIETKDETMLAAAAGPPRFVAAQVAADYRQELERAKEAARLLKAASQDSVDKAQVAFIDNVRFAYRFKENVMPFRIQKIYTDGKFTYIEGHPQEPPAVYEIKDGKPNLIEFEFSNDRYVIRKVVENGYLQIGKKKLIFEKRG